LPAVSTISSVFPNGIRSREIAKAVNEATVPAEVSC
jgi:hypothetical protein